MRARRIRRDSALATLRRLRSEFERSYGVSRIGLFGSVARDQAHAGSDVDVVVEMLKPDLFYMVHIKQRLEAELRCSVDLVHYRHQMNAVLKESIDRDAVYA